MPGVVPVNGRDRTVRVVVDNLSGGWSNRSFPHLIGDTKLYVADNVVFNRDGLVSKRPGNILYGGGSGATGSGQPIQSMARFYPVGSAPQLLVQSNGSLYKGNDATGAFTSVSAGLSSINSAQYAQIYDPDMSTGAATAMIVVDGAHVPQLYDGTHFVPVTTGSAGGVQYLPSGRSGLPITPAYVLNWKYHLVYAGDPTEPTAIYISDALRPERFNGYGLLDSAGTAYTPYFPAGRDGSLGVVTGLATVGPYIIVFFTSGIVAGINTGTYGAFQYEFAIVSTSTGCTAPRSIVSFEGFVVFFGGDRFYATDGNTVVVVPDEVPSVYATSSVSAFPSEMKSKGTTVAGRRGTQYWAAYDNIGAGQNQSIAVFDLAANGGWTFGSQTGGAWARWPSGMPLSAMVECRGPGDNQQLFWGSSTTDRVAQHDTGLYSDFGQPIAIEVRAKAYFLDKPIWPKKVQALYVLMAFPTSGAAYEETVVGYIVYDTEQDSSPPVFVGVAPSGVAYGTMHYGTFAFGTAQSQIIGAQAKTYPAQPSLGNSVQPGCTESSINPFNVIGFVLEVTIDEPSP